MSYKILRAHRVLLLLAVFILGIPSAQRVAHGQTTTGSIYGTVSDNSGAVVPGVSVTVTNTQTGTKKVTTTGGSGDYTFLVLDPGDYTVSTQITGFQTQTQTGIRLAAAQSVHVNFALQVGSTDQNISVEADTTLVDTRESQIGETIDQKRIQDLPLNGRNAYDLTAGCSWCDELCARCSYRLAAGNSNHCQRYPRREYCILSRWLL